MVLHLPANPDKLLAGILSDLLHGCPVHFGRPAGVLPVIRIIKACPDVPCVSLVPPQSEFSNGSGSLAYVHAVTLDLDDQHHAILYPAFCFGSISL